ncbi:hypothetical protein M918_07245 [Clostridium sp. BL8]|uniref:hypothetical protein n=1 Tax=Clostridium sp. BL8 TaxID=1354301 RepID=UPI00038A10D3|nr:hypothetical protein [Clostridium sp. BL8]EQB87833.1 hypothetical protein M918_07245 [Clostridium sp. BL8]
MGVELTEVLLVVLLAGVLLVLLLLLVIIGSLLVALFVEQPVNGKVIIDINTIVRAKHLRPQVKSFF